MEETAEGVRFEGEGLSRLSIPAPPAPIDPFRRYYPESKKRVEVRAGSYGYWVFRREKPPVIDAYPGSCASSPKVRLHPVE